MTMTTDGTGSAWDPDHVEDLHLPIAPRIRRGEAPPRLTFPKLTHEQKRRARRTRTMTFRAVFEDPMLLWLASRIPHESSSKSGRKNDYPAWVYLAMLMLVSVCGSLSEAEAELHDPDTWHDACERVRKLAASHQMEHILHDPQHGINALIARGHGPSRGQFYYFRNTRLVPEVAEQISQAATEFVIQRMQSLHLADPCDPHRFNHLTASRVMKLDGKIVNSPIRTLASERVNTATGEIRAVRHDDARGLYGEGGEDNMAHGSKWTNAIVSAPTTNIRFNLPAAYIPHQKGHGGEASAFVDFLKRTVPLFNGGLDAVIIDGAMTGTHIEEVQSTTGILVISPPKRAGRRDMFVTDPEDGTKYLAKALPLDTKHQANSWPCQGRGLLAAAGTVWTTTRLADGRAHHEPVRRGQIKRQNTAAGYAFSIQLTIEHCHHCAQAHTWWESLTKKKTDGSFNRAHYLRAYTPLDRAEWGRVYGMRPDVESDNNKIERTWYGQRIPAWGKHNQQLIMLSFALLAAVTSRRTYQHYLQQQHPLVA